MVKNRSSSGWMFNSMWSESNEKLAKKLLDCKSVEIDRDRETDLDTIVTFSTLIGFTLQALKTSDDNQ